MAKISIKPTTSTRETNRLLAIALADELKKRFHARQNRMEQRVRYEVERRIIATPEWASLTSNGKLVAELGVDNAKQRCQALLKHWLHTTKVLLTKPPTIRGAQVGMTIKVIGAGLVDMSDSINLPEANIELENGGVWPWLKWLTLEGDRVINSVFYWQGNDYVSREFSRTGHGIMRDARGRKWNVPPEYSGSEGNNFITDALRGIEETIGKIVIEELTR